MPTSPLPVIRLDFPCQMPWDSMTPVNGDPHVRHCTQCDLDVRDLSAMPADEAEAYLLRQRGRTCISFLHDPAGAMVTLDYQPSLSPRRWPKSIAAAAIAVATLAAGAAVLVPEMSRARGGVTMRPFGAYSPFSPSTNPAFARQRTLLPLQLQDDASLQPLLTALPPGIEIIDLQYNVYPRGLPEDVGRCIALGRRGSGPSGDLAATPIEAVVWLMSSGYVTTGDLATSDPAHPLRLLKSSRGGDVLVWTEDAELERVLESVNLVSE